MPNILGRLHQKGWSLLLFVSVLLLLHGLYLRYGSAASEVKWDVPFEFDERLPDDLPESLQFSDGVKLTLAVFLPAGPATNRIRYLGAVDRVHRPNGLRVVGVLPGTHSTVEWYSKDVNLPFEVIPDEHSEIHMLFRVPPNHGHTAIALFNREGRIKFNVLTIPEEDEIRQVVEKYLIGSVDYDYRARKDTILKPGEELPAGSFRLLGRAASGVEPRERLIVFFPPGCSSCQAEQFGRQILYAVTRAKDSGKLGKPFVLVIPDESLTADWTSVIRDNFVSEGQRPEIWLSMRPSIIWDNYYTRYLEHDSVPVLVRTGKQGEIAFAGDVATVVREGGLP